MSAVSSFLSAARSALRRLTGRGAGSLPEAAIDGIGYRVAVLRVREGRIIEQSARLNGC
ncbi:MAG: hypothetical protein AB7R90_02565 [Reyranellaceae bacterium]